MVSGNSDERTRRQILRMGSAAVPAAHAAQRTSRQRSPNILWIFADDQSWRSVGCYGYRPWSWVRTPNIDALAAEGVRFDRAYCNAWCVPSRVTMMTGKQVHAVTGYRQRDAAFDPTLFRFWPSALRKAGYHTSFIGKWHIPGYDERNLWNRDWDNWTAWIHGDVGHRNGGYYGDPDHRQRLNIDGRNQWVDGYSTDTYTERAVESIRRNRGRPWFLWLCYGASHAPYIPAERHKNRYTDVDVPIPSDVFGPREGKPSVMRDFTMFERGSTPGGPPIYNPGGYPPRTLPEYVRLQNRTVCAIDEGVARLMEALASSGQLDNTLVVYSSDNGFPWGEHGFANKNGPYDACTRTPLIVRWPRAFPRGGVVSHAVSQLSLIPTFFSLANVPLPWEMHGHSLENLLRNPSTGWQHPVMMEYFNETFGAEAANWNFDEIKGKKIFEPPSWWLTFHLGRYRYIRWVVENEIEELYDLENDPEELQNLALKREHRRTLEMYRNRMEALIRMTNGRLADRLPKPATV